SLPSGWSCRGRCDRWCRRSGAAWCARTSAWPFPLFSLLALGVDDLARDRLRNVLVAIELHGERGPPLRRRAQVGGVAEHGGERDARRDDLGVAARLQPEDVAAARVEVPHHVAEVLLGGHDLDGHDRLE